jgi:AraC-like DNA-binding protein
MTTYFDTADVASRHRVAAWRKQISETFVELECESFSPTEFHGSFSNRVIGDIQLSRVHTGPHFVSRTRRIIAKSNQDCFLLSLQTAGSGTIEQDGRTAILGPGDIAIYDTTRPYDIRFDEPAAWIVVRLPRPVVSGRLADPESYTALKIDGSSAIGKLTSTLITQVHEGVDHVAPTSLARLHACMIDLTATALVEQAGSTVQGSEWQVSIRRRILSHIDANLSDPTLTCASVALANGISERYLRKLFAGSLSLSDWIWTRRLDQAKRDLADPLLSHLGITAIGYDVGFKDTAHFSRAFKSKFGVTPSQYRATALGSLARK